jgi:hypothetical protein
VSLSSSSCCSSSSCWGSKPVHPALCLYIHAASGWRARGWCGWRGTTVR